MFDGTTPIRANATGNLVLDSGIGPMKHSAFSPPAQYP